MRILLLTPWPLTSTGGISSIVKMLHEQFRRKGHEAVVLVTNGPRTLRVLDRLSGTPVYGLYLRQPHVAEAPVRGLVSFVFYFLRTLFHLATLLRRHKIDAVIVQYPLPNAFYFGLLRKLARWKLIVAYQGNDAHDLHLSTPTQRYLTRLLLKEADAVLAVSRTLLDKVKEAFPDLELARASIVPNGTPMSQSVDATRRPNVPQTASPYVLTVGQLIERKGIDVVIRALASARQHGCDLNLLVVGDGPEHQRLMAVAEESGVARHVVFVGSRSHEQVLDLMKESLFFVLGSRAEGMPLVIAEAMGCGKAVVSTNVDGIPDIVRDGSTGLLVNPDDAEAFGRALVQLYSDRALRQTFGQRARELALREFTWEVIADRYLQLGRT